MVAKAITFLYKNILKPLLFLRDPESVHDQFTFLGSILGKFSFTKKIARFIFRFDHEALRQNIFGIDFHNPIGLSAGFDKDANLVQILDDVGFGYMQVGSVTYNSYSGNPKPRLHRLKKSKGLVVYYGLKNLGSDKIFQRLKNSNVSLPLSISIAKTNAQYTSTDKSGIEDYYNCFKMFAKESVGDFYTINISCPNTFGGEPFTTPKKLDDLLTKLDTVETNKSICIKMPVDLAWPEFKLLLDVIVKHNVHGVIISNLTKKHDSDLVFDDIPNNVKGGISGKPTEQISNALIKQTYMHYGDKLKIIGVGGVFSANDAYIKIKYGASLIQLITGMIFEGPALIGKINSDLVKLIHADGYKNISEAIGSGVNNK